MGDHEDNPDTISPDNRFSRRELIGQGAFKTVYSAFDHHDGIEVAWNEVRVLDEPDAREKVLAEIALLQSLHHPAIINMLAFWEQRLAKQTRIVFITELMTSGTLRTYIERARKIKLRIIRRWCRQILDGLMYLHSQKIIHRDLKCDNIFINGTRGELKIGDLGLSIALSGTCAVSCIGTPEFMAPELYEGNYDEKVDIYAFGMCVLEMVTGRYPYSECNHPAQIFKKVTAGEPPQTLFDVPFAEVRDFIRACITKDPGKRPSAQELLQSPFLNHDDDEMSEEFVDLGSRNNLPVVQCMKPDFASRVVQMALLLPLKGKMQSIEFPFNLDEDRPSDVAVEMVRALREIDEGVDVDTKEIMEAISLRLEAVLADRERWREKNSSDQIKMEREKAEREREESERTERADRADKAEKLKEEMREKEISLEREKDRQKELEHEQVQKGKKDDYLLHQQQMAAAVQQETVERTYAEIVSDSGSTRMEPLSTFVPVVVEAANIPNSSTSTSLTTDHVGEGRGVDVPAAGTNVTDLDQESPLVTVSESSLNASAHDTSSDDGSFASLGSVNDPTQVPMRPEPVTIPPATLDRRPSETRSFSPFSDISVTPTAVPAHSAQSPQSAQFAQQPPSVSGAGTAPSSPLPQSQHLSPQRSRSTSPQTQTLSRTSSSRSDLHQAGMLAAPEHRHEKALSDSLIDANHELLQTDSSFGGGRDRRISSMDDSITLSHIQSEILQQQNGYSHDSLEEAPADKSLPSSPDHHAIHKDESWDHMMRRHGEEMRALEERHRREEESWRRRHQTSTPVLQHAPLPNAGSNGGLPTASQTSSGTVQKERIASANMNGHASDHESGSSRQRPSSVSSATSSSSSIGSVARTASSSSASQLGQAQSGLQVPKPVPKRPSSIKDEYSSEDETLEELMKKNMDGFKLSLGTKPAKEKGHASSSSVSSNGTGPAGDGDPFLMFTDAKQPR